MQMAGRNEFVGDFARWHRRNNPAFTDVKSEQGHENGNSLGEQQCTLLDTQRTSWNCSLRLSHNMFWSGASRNSPCRHTNLPFSECLMTPTAKAFDTTQHSTCSTFVVCDRAANTICSSCANASFSHGNGLNMKQSAPACMN